MSSKTAPPVHFSSRPAAIPLLFPNAPLQSLTTSQAHLALTTPLALKFPRSVSPFCAVREHTPEAIRQLASLFEPGEASYIVLGENSTTSSRNSGTSEQNSILCTTRFMPNFHVEGPFGVVQMLWPEDHPIPAPTPSASQIVPIEPSQAAEMVALTDIAFPGFFRIDTNRMGPYYGIRSETTGELLAMVGERLNINNFRELSGLCTHPEHRGKGYGQHLMNHLLRIHKFNGYNTYLHASTPNTHAINLYQRMGFILLGEFQLLRLTLR